MNNLSLFIYIADRIGNLSDPLIGVLMVCLLIFIIGNFVAFSDYVNRNSRDDSPFKFWGKRWVWIAGGIFAFLIFLPSKQAMYLIAASEIGEVAIQTEEAQLIYQDIRAVLQSYQQVSAERH